MDGFSTVCPSILISPDEGFKNPAIALSSVDFPQPDGPSRQINSPFST